MRKLKRLYEIDVAIFEIQDGNGLTLYKGHNHQKASSMYKMLLRTKWKGFKQITRQGLLLDIIGWDLKKDSYESRKSDILAIVPPVIGEIMESVSNRIEVSEEVTKRAFELFPKFFQTVRQHM